jgi:competence protein ComEC
VWAVLGVAAGLWLGSRAVWAGGWTIAVTAAAGGLVTCVAATVGVRGRRAPGAVAMAACGLAAGVVVGGLFWASVASQGARMTASGRGSWEFLVTSDPTVGQFGASSSIRVLTPAGFSADVRVNWPKGARPARLGERVVAYGTAAPAKRDEGAEADFQRGIAGTLRVRVVRASAWDAGLSGWVGRLRDAAGSRIDAAAGAAAPMLASTLLGERWRVAGSPTDEDMRAAGLAHFEATSGYHVMLLAMLVEWALLRAGMSRGGRLSILTIVLAGFVALSGGRVSAVRSVLVGAIGGVGGYLGRRGSALSVLAVVAAAFLLVSPDALFDLGFQLSTLGLAGILLFAGLAEGWIRAAVGWRLRWVAGPVGMTCCAVACTLPLTASAFGVVSVVAPLSNLLAVPVVMGEFILGIVGLGVGVAWAPVGAFVLGGAAACAGMLGALAGWLARLPGACLPVTASSLAVAAGWVAVLAVLWAWWPQPRPRRARICAALLVLALGLFVVGAPPAGGPTIVVMDVGQGDAILVRDGAHSVLVDTGPDAGHILAALARNGVRRIDAVVLTHLHADHFGGLAALASVVRVPALYISQGGLGKPSTVIAEAERRTGAVLGELGDGDRLTVGAIQLDVVSPHGPVPDAGTNEASVVMVARVASATVLLTGDAESGVLEGVATRGELPAVGVLKVGHHGSAISLSPRVLEATRPGAAVISVGAGNRFKHPRPAPLALLSAGGIATYRTDLAGDVTIRLDPAGCRLLMATPHGRVALGVTRARWVRVDLPAPACGTLGVVHDRTASNTETHGRLARRPQARLPHLRDRGPPSVASACPADQAGGRGG